RMADELVPHRRCALELSVLRTDPVVVERECIVALRIRLEQLDANALGRVTQGPGRDLPLLGHTGFPVPQAVIEREPEWVECRDQVAALACGAQSRRDELLGESAPPVRSEERRVGKGVSRPWVR